MLRYAHKMRMQLLIDRDCSRTVYKIWTQRGAAIADANAVNAAIGEFDRNPALVVTANNILQQRDMALAVARAINAAATRRQG